MKMLAHLPMAISLKIAAVLTWLSYFFHSRNRRVTETNLRLCYPDMSEQDRIQLTRESLKASGIVMVELARVWFRPAYHDFNSFEHIEGKELLLESINDPERGTILISPHLGNWEVIGTYMATLFEFSALYRPPKIAELDPVVVAAREKYGLKMLKTSQLDVRKMLRILKKSGAIYVLPDQIPPKGSGVFAPFYGQPAYTMTLLQGLAKRTGSRIIMSIAIRTEEGFRLAFSPVDIDVSLSTERYAEQLNSHIAEVIDKNPEQFAWAYKRFKTSPEDGVDIYK
ncbi:MAG: hypothetical protein DRQ47_08145 [Gammaproteobacteria bacterium]|nr:MAG: hypothetical protein DRQ47_08145 [Gammaproteobacteria bacterium]